MREFAQTDAILQRPRSIQYTRLTPWSRRPGWAGTNCFVFGLATMATPHICLTVYYNFYARQHIRYKLLRVYAIARPFVRPSVRLSVCLSVRHTGGSVKNG